MGRVAEVRPVGILAKVALANLTTAELAKIVGVLTQTAPDEVRAALACIERDRAGSRGA